MSAIAVIFGCAAAVPAFAEDGFIACEALAVTADNDRFALHNVSRGEAGTATASFDAYKTWAQWQPELNKQIRAVRNADPTIIVARLTGECRPFSALAEAQNHAAGRMRELSPKGYFNISTDWQPKSTTNPVTIVYAACELFGDVDSTRKVAVHNLSRHDASSSPNVVAQTYFDARTYNRDIIGGLEQLAVDPRPVIERLQATCTAFDTAEQAEQRYRESMQKRSAEGYTNIVTKWQPPLPRAAMP